ncbi:MAG: hypothetical protein ACK5EA_26875, partial [Planctomycetaceae bacterium]
FKTALEDPIPLRPHLLDQADEPFVAIVERAMAKQPSDRYATAREMREAIEAWVRECHPEVPLPVAPARVEDLLEVSGARPKADLRTGSSPSFSGAVSHLARATRRSSGSSTGSPSSGVGFMTAPVRGWVTSHEGRTQTTDSPPKFPNSELPFTATREKNAAKP